MNSVQSRSRSPCTVGRSLPAEQHRSLTQPGGERSRSRTWVESGQWPQCDKVAGHSSATKGLFEKFSALWMKDGVLQRT